MINFQNIIKHIKWNKKIGLFLFFGMFVFFDGCFFNEKPWIAGTDHGFVIPMLESTNKNIDKIYKWRVGPFFPYSNTTMDLSNINRSPFGKQVVKGVYYRHWMGTDYLGRDVFANVVNGIKLALKISSIASFLAILIACFLTYLIGLQSMNRNPINLLKMIGLLLLMSVFVFYVVWLLQLTYDVVIVFFVLSLFFIGLFFWQNRKNKLDNWIVNWDPMVLKVLEIFRVLPALIWILMIVGYFNTKGEWTLITIIGLLIWPYYTRLLRSEMFDILSEDYIKSARLSGHTFYQIYIRHIIPNILMPILIAFTYSVSSIILLEATLSFLGIGLSSDINSLGQMIKQGRLNFNSWWLIVFPGTAILGILYVLDFGRKWVVQKVN